MTLYFKDLQEWLHRQFGDPLTCCWMLLSPPFSVERCYLLSQRVVGILAVEPHCPLHVLFCLLHSSSDPLGSRTSIHYHYTSFGLVSIFLALELESAFLFISSQKKPTSLAQGSGWDYEAGSVAPSFDGWFTFRQIKVASFWSLSHYVLLFPHVWVFFLIWLFLHISLCVHFYFPPL